MIEPEPKATRYGKLYWRNKDFFKRKKIRQMIKSLSNSKLSLYIDRNNNK